MTTPTEQIDQWIAEHGSARDALNVALARLNSAEAESAGRLRALNDKADEARQEWQRAENAEAALELARKQCEHLEHESAPEAEMQTKGQ